MKRGSCSPRDSLVSLFDDDELEVSAILLQIPRIIFESENRNRFLPTWGVRKRRSAIDPDLYPASVPSSSSPYLLGTCVGPTWDNDNPTAKIEASSPATPLSFSPSESDGKSKRSKKRVSNKKKKEDWLKMVEGLTHQKESLKKETENVKQFYNTLKALNSELKAKKQQLNLDTAIPQAKVESIEQAHPQEPLPLLLHHSTPTSALVANPMGPHVIPDLNVSPDETQTLGLKLSSPLDLNLSIAPTPNSTQLKRAATAQARQRRLQIYRAKKPKASPIQINF